jgi:26S proteasome regulatory subunit N6
MASGGGAEQRKGNKYRWESKEIQRQAVHDESKPVREREEALLALASTLRHNGEAQALRNLPNDVSDLLEAAPRAKAAKLVRQLVDALAGVPNTRELQVSFCQEQAQWARQQKRTFLRHRVQARLASLHQEGGNHRACLSLLSQLLSEVKQLDDKLLLVDLHLVESRAHHALRNTPKAKAALTSARTAANAIYVPPSVQSQIDLQSGVLHAEENDCTTAFSYFFEAYEQLHSLCEKRSALRALKYMLMCKVMANQAEEVHAIASSKGGPEYAGRDLDAMKECARASVQRSLKMLDTALSEYEHELKDDVVIGFHVGALHSTLLERNLLRLVEPFSRVEISHVANLIDLPHERVERKLSQMILDGTLDGILDEGNGCLIVHDVQQSDSVYPTALKAIENMGRVVDSLSTKSARAVTGGAKQQQQKHKKDDDSQAAAAPTTSDPAGGGPPAA